MHNFVFVSVLAFASVISSVTHAEPMITQQSPATHPIQWRTQYSEAISLAQSTNKPIVILFTGTSWCPACMKLEKEVIQNPEFEQAVGDKFIFLKAEFKDYTDVSILQSPYKSLLDRYNVSLFPTFVVINRNGEKLGTTEYQPGGPSMFAERLLGIANQHRQ